MYLVTLDLTHRFTILSAMELLSRIRNGDLSTLFSMTPAPERAKEACEAWLDRWDSLVSGIAPKAGTLGVLIEAFKAERFSDTPMEFSEEDVKTIRNACEVYMRLAMGQLDVLLDEIPVEAPGDSRQSRAIHELVDIWRRHGAPSLGIRGVGQISQIACDIHHVLRHRLAWDAADTPPQRDWHTMLTVDYDEPMKIANHPLPQISRANELTCALQDMTA